MGAFPFVVFSFFLSSHSSSFPFLRVQKCHLHRDNKKKERLSDEQRDEKEEEDKERGHGGRRRRGRSKTPLHLFFSPRKKYVFVLNFVGVVERFFV